MSYDITWSDIAHQEQHGHLPDRGTTGSEMRKYYGDDLDYEPEHVAAVERDIAVERGESMMETTEEQEGPYLLTKVSHEGVGSAWNVDCVWCGAMLATLFDTKATALANAKRQSHECATAPCGCPTHIVRDGGHQEGCEEATSMGNEKENLEYDGDTVSVTAEIWPDPSNPHIWAGEYAVWTDTGADGPYRLERDSHDDVVAAVEAVARERGAL